MKQHYKVRVKGKVKQSWECSCALRVIAIEKRAFRSRSIKVANFTLVYEKMYKKRYLILLPKTCLIEAGHSCLELKP